MSDAPLTKTTVKTARAISPPPRPRTLVRAKPLVTLRAKPLSDTDTFAFGDTLVRRRSDLGPINIRIDVSKPAAVAALTWGSFHSASSVAHCLMQLFIQEAPAWTVSMIVHMLTLVTMAMVTVVEPAPYHMKQLVVTPPEEEKVEEEIKDVESDQPTTLDNTTQVESLAFESSIEQERVTVEPSNEPEAAPAATDLTGYGNDRVLKSEYLTMVGVYGGTGFAGRGAVAKAKLLMQDGGSEASERSVNIALQWLARHQMPDGGWSFNHTECPTCRGQCRNPGKMAEARNAATALALLPFLGTGQTHREGNHRTTIKNGLAFLVNRMKMGPHGGALNEEGGNMYSHGLAAIALSEAYAMTGDRGLLVPAQSALNFIAYAQDPVGGGWRYQPREKGDTSMIGWQLMALKSGHMAELQVSPLTIQRAMKFLDSVQCDDGATYSYFDPGKSSEAPTAIGLLCRMYLGWKRDNPALQQGIKFIASRGPSGANMYYNYYATQVMHHWEGEEWKNWNRQMRDQLIHAQAKQGHEEGSWFTGGGDHGATPGGRLYCTAMATMILEVYYRHLPIYRSQSVEDDFPE